MIVGYSDGTMCSLGVICKCTNVSFGYDDNPQCCPGAKCGDVYINIQNGNVYKFYGRNWDLIGDIRGPTGPTGSTGSTGNAIEMVVVDNDKNLIVTLTDGQMLSAGNVAGPTGIDGPTGPTGTYITDAIVDSNGNISFVFSNGTTIDSGYVQGPTGYT